MTGEEYCGSIAIFAANFVPEDYLLCDGQTYAIKSMQALYSIIGTYYGGDGRATFQVPDFRGRVPLGWGHGINLTNRNLGEQGGSESMQIQLTVKNLPQHAHAAEFDQALLTPRVTTTADLNSFKVGGSLLCNSGAGNRGPFQGYPGNSGNSQWSATSNGTMAPAVLQNGTVSGIEVFSYFNGYVNVSTMSAGQQQAFQFNNMTPYTALNYAIRYTSPPYPPHT
ncbi:MAG: tail fiber protein [Leptospiraceae bacterium]|nr:tail fiber protein [Leptospiraceae bacterium]